MYYTNDQIEAFARAQDCTVPEFKKRWIIQLKGAYYVHGPNGYLPSLGITDLGVSMPRDLAAVPPSNICPAGIDWDVPWGDRTKPKTTDALLREYATVARGGIIARMDIEKSYFDATTQTFYERVCPLRKITPEYDENIDTWLRLLGGKDVEIFLDWIATLTDLSRVTCAIYLHAGKDYGKSMLACGLARLWGYMPTEMESANGNFNSALLNCPLVFADEELPRGITSGFIRKFIATSSRSLRRKNMPEAELMGAIRLIIAANNDTLLEFDDENFSPDDIDAVAARILYIRCDPGAAEFLKSIGNYAGTRDWVTGDKIAKHALWLRANRNVSSDGRFLVQGEIDMIHRRLAVNGNIRGQAVEWVCRALVHQWGEPNPGIQFGGGSLYVNASFVKQTWEQIVGDIRTPSLQKIGRAFKPLSLGEKRLKLGMRRADFYKIDASHIYENCNAMQIATREDLERLINRPTLVEDDDGTPPAAAPAAPFGPTPANGGYANGGQNGSIAKNGNGYASSGPLPKLDDVLPFPNKPSTSARSLFDDLSWA